ncbi:MAG: ribose-5-phosphate isomerase RpiA [Proteobacteria bacterium]|nr:ribose-5-phosphate isomerase RpiA [Pseudomonadota bacterium]
MPTQDDKKRAVAVTALGFVEESMVLGVGTGSTINHFIAALAARKIRLKAAVSSSSSTSRLLREAGIEELDLNTAGELDLYIDGADEATPAGLLIKGGGAALTREKIVAAASRKFLCLVDDSKIVSRLGRFPLPVEVIPMARSYVARRLVALGGQPVWREGVTTDNGNQILDVHHLQIDDPVTLESAIDGIAGMVTVGLFARRGADVLLVGGDDGVRTLRG